MKTSRHSPMMYTRVLPFLQDGYILTNGEDTPINSWLHGKGDCNAKCLNLKSISIIGVLSISIKRALIYSLWDQMYNI